MDAPESHNLTKSWHEQTPQKLPLAENVAGFTTWDWSPDGKKLGGTITNGDKRFLGIYTFETNSYTKIAETTDFIPVMAAGQPPHGLCD